MAREEGTYKGGSLQPSVGLQENVSQEMLCKKKEGKAYLIIVMLFAILFAMLFTMLFTMLFATIVNHIGVRIMIFAMLFAMLFAPYGKSSKKILRVLGKKLRRVRRASLMRGKTLKKLQGVFLWWTM